MEQLFDLPAHPLIIHFPVVGIPVLTLVTIWLALRPAARRRYGIGAIVLAVVVTITTILAASSGQALVDASPFFTEEAVSKHKSLGETLRIFVALMSLALIGLVVLGRTRDQGNARGRLVDGNDPSAVSGAMSDSALNAGAFKDPAMMGLGGIAVVLALLSAVWTVRTGHEGAKSTWGEVFVEEDAATVETAPGADPTAVPEPDPTVEPEPEPTVAVVADPEPTADVYGNDPTPEPEAEPTPEPEPDGEQPGGQEGDVDPDVIALGMTIYTRNCAGCHSSDGVGTGRGPSLIGVATSIPEISDHVAIVVNGVPPKMPAFDSLTEEEVDAVVAYTRATFTE